MEPRSIAGILVGTIFITAFLFELLGGKISGAQRPLRDLLFTAVGVLSQTLVFGAAVGVAAGYLVALIWADSAGALSATPFWIAFSVVFFLQEFLHYWVHRYAHEWRWLWKLHRTHHSAIDLNVGVLYRFNIFWVPLLPQAWVGAAAVYLGLGEAFIAAVLTTFTINVLTHTSYRWDLWLRQKMPWTEPVWWVVERVVTLPDTHHAHHSYGKSAHPNGNYATSVFLFDVILGTAKIPNVRQDKFGLPISPRLHWAEELFWPIIRKPLLPKVEKAESQVAATGKN
jgi:sterol desaturase/sphingolipid hydroxylase (fatty acid hydroxylase superfamily)